MKRRGATLIVIVALAAAAAAVGVAQSLEELAQKEKARRKHASGAKTFTNDDLSKPSPSPSPEAEADPKAGRAVRRRIYQPSAGAVGGTPTETTEGQRTEGRRANEGGSEEPPSVDDAGAEAYWRDRMKAAEAAVRAAQKEVGQAQGKIDLSRKGVGQPLPIDGTQQLPLNPMLKPPDLVEAEAELAAAKTNLAAAQKALEDLREEARRKGALPGWLR